MWHKPDILKYCDVWEFSVRDWNFALLTNDKYPVIDFKSNRYYFNIIIAEQFNETPAQMLILLLILLIYIIFILFLNVSKNHPLMTVFFSDETKWNPRETWTVQNSWQKMVSLIIRIYYLDTSIWTYLSYLLFPKHRYDDMHSKLMN